MFGAESFDAILPPGGGLQLITHEAAELAASLLPQLVLVCSDAEALRPSDFEDTSHVSCILTWLAQRAGTAAILAVAASKPVVTADAAGRIGVEKQMLLNLTCDHRIVYGADAAEFMLSLKKVIEAPDQLIF